MQNLFVEQRGPSGQNKSWKLRSEAGLATIGHSKHADLRTTGDSMKGIHGVFEFKNEHWYYINLDLHTQHGEMTPGKTEICLDQEIELRIGTSTFVIRPLEARHPLFSQLDSLEISATGKDRHPYQLFTVFSGETLLETSLIPVHKNFTSQFDPHRTRLTPEKTTVWKKTQVGSLEISQRTVYLNRVEAMQRLPLSEMVDEEGRKSLIFTLSAAFLLALMFVLSPKHSSTEETLTAIPKSFPLEVKIKPPEKKKVAEKPPQEKSVEAPPPGKTQQAAAPKNAGGSSKAASLIKNLASGRISTLIGKVSATAARSSNVVVTSGIAAGTAPTGRALAALGSINRAGKDWSAEGQGTGITISTNGKAGGRATAGMGTLAAGGTGTNGVGLLEEEGEIVGGLDREVIAAYIRSRLGEILYCYERQLSATPDLYGKVGVRFTIMGDGAVQAQRVGETTLKSPPVEGCILQKISRWKFPVPEGGTKVLVTYPFLFKSTN